MVIVKVRPVVGPVALNTDNSRVVVRGRELSVFGATAQGGPYTIVSRSTLCRQELCAFSYFFLKNLVTSKGAVSHNDMFYTIKSTALH